MTLRSSLWL